MDDLTKSESSSDSFLPLKKRMRPFEEEPDHNALLATETEKVASSGNARYKGVFQQQNGHWGAQIYAGHKRIWLGTFKSATEAATAYDSASIKIRPHDANSHRNFPWSDSTVQEPEFQEDYTIEAVVNMIKDGTYQQKFRDFVRTRSQMAATVGSKQSRGDEESNNCFSCKQLFTKKLTPSDVGKLNRLVIPKKYAVKHLPPLSVDQNEREEGEVGGSVDDVEVVFYDKAKTQWKFKYCYMRTSQTFAFTIGWNRFVKEKKLKENDVIVFYQCNDECGFKKMIDVQSNKMIDVQYFSDNGFVDPKGVNNKLEDEETKSAEEKKGGFMLFGVRIQQ
ncbi:AP2/ERF and B3 domain-containing transcription factor At1g50680 [Eutrema salsugineum]|uniref:AP2/ERF and B3 domain-containing transcription factor At1g50680 n=1 Tax=Eutrema salsugineum TaxID=72664 RepID=UPI000CED07D3|nr:AP2/ERF and B3 domain-containing transcription factor At1g50680 [Eutrema salsugineum]